MAIFLHIPAVTTRCGVNGKDDEQPRWQDNLFLKQSPITSMKISRVGASSMRSKLIALSSMLIGGCNKGL